MFDYTMQYENSKGDFVLFNSLVTGLYLDESGLFSYSWAATSANGRIASIVREPREIPVSILYLSDRPESINDFDDCIDYDARVCKPGTLWLNGYTISGIFVASEAQDYQWKKGYMC